MYEINEIFYSRGDVRLVVVVEDTHISNSRTIVEMTPEELKDWQDKKDRSED